MGERLMNVDRDGTMAEWQRDKCSCAGAPERIKHQRVGVIGCDDTSHKFGGKSRAAAMSPLDVTRCNIEFYHPTANLCGSLDFPAQPDGDAAQVSACSEATIDRPTRRVTKKKPPASAGGPVHALGIFATPYLPAAYSGMASS